MSNRRKDIFPDDYLLYSKDQRLKIKEKNNDLLLYYIRLALEAEPMLSSLKCKAKGVENFLNIAGVKVLCVDSYIDNSSGISICDCSTKKELAFIKTNSVLINKLYDLYYSGKFSALGGPAAENIQNTFTF